MSSRFNDESAFFRTPQLRSSPVPTKKAETPAKNRNLRNGQSPEALFVRLRIGAFLGRGLLRRGLFRRRLFRRGLLGRGLFCRGLRPRFRPRFRRLRRRNRTRRRRRRMVMMVVMVVMMMRRGRRRRGAVIDDDTTDQQQRQQKRGAQPFRHFLFPPCFW